MQINTQQCISILKFINKMEIKKELIEGIKRMVRLNNESEIINQTIIDKLGENRKDIKEVAKFLIENEDIRNKKDDIEGEKQEILFNIVFLIIEGIPKAEDIFYKTIADIKGTDVNTVKGLDGAETVGFLKEIINSETFKGFFSLTMK